MATNYPDAKGDDSFQDGLEFQDYVMRILLKYGIVFQPYSSKKYQFEQGESAQGIELKLDRLCTKTNRLSIEIAEKQRSSDSIFKPSGIYRDDNTWLYIQGNYDILFIFDRKVLVRAHKSGKYQEHVEPTVKAFYLSLLEAEELAARMFKRKT